MSENRQSRAESQKGGGYIPEMKLKQNSKAAGEAWKGPKQRPKRSAIGSLNPYRNAFTADVSSSLTSNTV
jgi:hypothetical protein